MPCSRASDTGVLVQSSVSNLSQQIRMEADDRTCQEVSWTDTSCMFLENGHPFPGRFCLYYPQL